MALQKFILVVDDEAVNRKLLHKLLSQKYSVVEATNGEEALLKLEEYGESIIAVMLDIVMPVLDGYGFLRKIRELGLYSNLPIIVTTGSFGTASEIKALELGAWDYVLKPYDPDIIMFRLKNAIERSEYSAFEQLKYMSEHDALTDLFNRNKFFSATGQMIDENMDKKFVFVRLDIDRFKLINSFFGTNEGDELLIFIADTIRMCSADLELCTYCRFESDVFCICFAYENEFDMNNLATRFADRLVAYNPNYSISPCFGVCFIEDNSLPIETIYTRSTLASRSCKENRLHRFVFYTPEMSEKLSAEQEIINDMFTAIEEKQFEVYFQPKYSLYTESAHGAEALVRWRHPVKGMVSPGQFIPVFEKNGFITKLDYYVWEQVCVYIRQWLDSGIDVDPVSVNISRVDLYNPNFVNIIVSLADEYSIPHSLLNLELTESAYSDNPVMVANTMRELQKLGFVIMMDDFGCGYSSLNVLKDIAVDVLKIDMQFFSKTEIEGRGENIIASVIRMAKWLNIPVIAEGVETEEQVEFLRSVGCDYVQGYYYARPMPYEEYNDNYTMKKVQKPKQEKKEMNDFDMDALFSTNPQMELLFSNMLQAIAILEYNDGKFEVIRVNESYTQLMGYNDIMSQSANPILYVDEMFHKNIIDAFEKAINKQTVSSCEYLRQSGEKEMWIHMKLQYINKFGRNNILFATLSDISEQKKIDEELAKLRKAVKTE